MTPEQLRQRRRDKERSACIADLHAQHQKVLEQAEAHEVDMRVRELRDDLQCKENIARIMLKTPSLMGDMNHCVTAAVDVISAQARLDSFLKINGRG